MKKVDYITDFIINQEKPDTATSVDETWVDSYEVCTFLYMRAEMRRKAHSKK